MSALLVAFDDAAHSLHHLAHGGRFVQTDVTAEGSESRVAVRGQTYRTALATTVVKISAIFELIRHRLCVSVCARVCSGWGEDEATILLVLRSGAGAWG